MYMPCGICVAPRNASAYERCAVTLVKYNPRSRNGMPVASTTSSAVTLPDEVISWQRSSRATRVTRLSRSGCRLQRADLGPAL